MSVTLSAPNIPPGYYGTTAFQLVVNLLVLLKSKGTISEDDRVDLLNTVAAGLGPPSDPNVKQLKELLWQISGKKPSRLSAHVQFLHSPEVGENDLALWK